MRTTAIFTALVALSMTAQAMPPPQSTDLAPPQGSVAPHQPHVQRGEHGHPRPISSRPPPQKGEPQPKRGEHDDARPLTSRPPLQKGEPQPKRGEHQRPPKSVPPHKGEPHHAA